MKRRQNSMKRSFVTIALTIMVAVAYAQGWPSNYKGVMLQGFFWDSFTDTQWDNLESQANEIGEFYDLIWVPQSGNCNSSYNQMGYTPVYWYDHNSSFGSEEKLRSMISAMKKKGVGVIADVVINHRGTLGVNGSWVDFPAETYNGKTWQLGLGDICRNDDGGATAKLYNITGANDTGEDWSGMRDLDHTSQNVQDNVINYLNFLHDDLGYAGYRYDMTKGYGAQYTALYNEKTNAEYSVGEYWDGNVETLKTWLNNSKRNGKIMSATFDFTTRYTVRDACASNTWSKLNTGGLATDNSYKRYAVTFVENHDTQYRSASEPGDPIKSFIETANAYIMATPGTPCVFLKHWKDYKKSIKQQIYARKAAGISNESNMSVVMSEGVNYVVKTTGDKGSLILAISNKYTAPTGYTKVLLGSNYHLYMENKVNTAWTSVPSGNYQEAFTTTLQAVTDKSGARLVYTTDGSDPTPSSSAVDNNASLNIDGEVTLKVGILAGGTVSGIITRHYSVKPFVAHKATVYLKDPNWSKVYFYAWDDKGQLNGSWPGIVNSNTTMINGQKWYYQTFDITAADYAFNIIFNKGLGDMQTVDIGPISGDKFYEIDGSFNGKYTVKDLTDTMTGISSPWTDGSLNRDVKVYDLKGRLVRTMVAGTDPSTATKGLNKGIYIVGNKKIVVSE